MIKVYTTGFIRHIFETDKEEVLEGSAGVLMPCFRCLPGSACYIRDNEIGYFNDGFTCTYPVDECRNPTEEELSLYESADVI